MTIIFHIDVNSAFLSWSAVEELKNGADRDLRKINAIVGGDQKSRHGIVLAKSQSAKRYGIRTGELLRMPLVSVRILWWYLRITGAIRNTVKGLWSFCGIIHQI